MKLRPYQKQDADSLLALFRDTVRRVNSRDYSPEQIRAWASDEIDAGQWAARFEGRFVMVAEREAGQWAGELVGFIELEEDGRIDRMFVSADCQRQGVGQALMAAAIAEASRRRIGRLWAEVSITAKPFFEAQGFTVVAEQRVRLRGVDFVNFRMEKKTLLGVSG